MIEGGEEYGVQVLGGFSHGEKEMSVVKERNEVENEAMLAKLKEKMDIAEEAWSSREKEVKNSQTIFKNTLWIKPDDLGQAGKELDDLKKNYEGTKERYIKLGGIEEIEPAATETEVVDMAQIGAVRDVAQPGEAVSAVSAVEREISGDENTPEKLINQIRQEFGVIDNARASIYAKYPDFVGIQIENKGNNLADVSNVEKMKALSVLLYLRDSFRALYKKTWKSLLDVGVGIDQSVLEMSAKDYISEHDQSVAVEIFAALKSKMTPEQIKLFKLDPDEGENVTQWTKKITDFILRACS